MASPAEKAITERVEKLVQEAAASLSDLKARQAEDPVDDLLAEEFDHRVPWRSCVAAGVAATRGCEMYWLGGDIRIVGRRSDIYAVVYAFLQICRDINQLTEREWRTYWITTHSDETESMRAWKNNFRLGVARAIERRFKTTMRREQEEAVKQRVDKLGLAPGNELLPTLTEAFNRGTKVGTEVAFDGPMRLKTEKSG